VNFSNSVSSFFNTALNPFVLILAVKIGISHTHGRRIPCRPPPTGFNFSEVGKFSRHEIHELHDSSTSLMQVKIQRPGIDVAQIAVRPGDVQVKTKRISPKITQRRRNDEFSLHRIGSAADAMAVSLRTRCWLKAEE